MKRKKRVKCEMEHEFIGGMCVDCTGDQFEEIAESDVNDEEVTRYKKFGVG